LDFAVICPPVTMQVILALLSIFSLACAFDLSTRNSNSVKKLVGDNQKLQSFIGKLDNIAFRDAPQGVVGDGVVGDAMNAPTAYIAQYLYPSQSSCQTGVTANTIGFVQLSGSCLTLYDKTTGSSTNPETDLPYGSLQFLCNGTSFSSFFFDATTTCAGTGIYILSFPENHCFPDLDYPEYFVNAQCVSSMAPVPLTSTYGTQMLYAPGTCNTPVLYTESNIVGYCYNIIAFDTTFSFTLTTTSASAVANIFECGNCDCSLLTEQEFKFACSAMPPSLTDDSPLDFDTMEMVTITTISTSSSSGLTNGGKFGIACTIFMLAVAAYTYFVNMVHINAMICCAKAAPLADHASTELSHI